MQNDETLIICPFAAEAKLLVSILPDCRQLDATSWQSRSTRLITLNAAGAKPLLNFLNTSGEIKKFRCVFLFGAAGALAGDLEPGQVFFCSQVQFCQQQISIETAFKEAEVNKTNLPGKQKCPSKSFLGSCSQITVENPVLMPADRLLLHKQTAAQIVDMESFFFAEAMKTMGIAHQIIRFISDTANQPFKIPFAANVRIGVVKSRQLILNHLAAAAS